MDCTSDYYGVNVWLWTSVLTIVMVCVLWPPVKKTLKDWWSECVIEYSLKVDEKVNSLGLQWKEGKMVVWGPMEKRKRLMDQYNGEICYRDIME